MRLFDLKRNLFFDTPQEIFFDLLKQPVFFVKDFVMWGFGLNITVLLKTNILIILKTISVKNPYVFMTTDSQGMHAIEIGLSYLY